MSAAKNPNNDPSMDDILASIRKIISDDEARAQISGQKPGAPLSHPPGISPSPRQSPPSDDVLLLTDLVEEPTKGPGMSSNTQPSQPRIDPIKAAEMPQPSVEGPADGSLVGPSVVGVASTAFARLNQAVQDSVPPPAAPDPGPAISNGGKTIEDLVKEMLRPMLKEWLDKNLPPMVERYVEREISRLTRR
jgi:cell pole-organizing protein PopZ